jgi:hypothetical protein
VGLVNGGKEALRAQLFRNRHADDVGLRAHVARCCRVERRAASSDGATKLITWFRPLSSFDKHHQD